MQPIDNEHGEIDYDEPELEEPVLVGTVDHLGWRIEIRAWEAESRCFDWRLRPPGKEGQGEYGQELGGCGVFDSKEEAEAHAAAYLREPPYRLGPFTVSERPDGSHGTY